MRCAARRSIAPAGLAAVVGLLAGSTVTPPPGDAQIRAVRLVGTDLPLGDGTALVMGGTGVPMPSQRYLDAADALYLQPLGFTGTLRSLATPEGLYPTTGVKSLTADASEAQGQQILATAIQHELAGVTPGNPVVVFGWSQSAAIASLTMAQLHDDGVPADALHFVLVGNTSNPNGGLLERFDLPIGSNPTVPGLGITFGGETPDGLYPTDVYTLEYDGFADFPQYPLNMLSVANALLGLVFEHLTYLSLTPEQIQNAIPLETAGDSLSHYYMIPSEDLPLLAPLRLIPIVGNPLADLLQPDLRVLVNLGYGSITEGWSDGPANVPTPFGLFPTGIDLGDIVAALAKGVPEGIEAALRDLQDPDNYRITPVMESPLVSTLVNAAYTTGITDTANPSLLEFGRDTLSNFANYPITDATLASSPVEIINALDATFTADYSVLLPIADTVNALRYTLTDYTNSLFFDHLFAGDLIGAIGYPAVAKLALTEFATVFGIGAPVGEAVVGTLLNLANLFA